MTRKDYELQALAFKRALAVVEFSEDQTFAYDAKSALALTATILADLLETDNARFDREKFLEACGVL